MKCWDKVRPHAAILCPWKVKVMPSTTSSSAAITACVAPLQSYVTASFLDDRATPWFLCRAISLRGWNAPQKSHHNPRQYGHARTLVFHETAIGCPIKQTISGAEIDSALVEIYRHKQNERHTVDTRTCTCTCISFVSACRRDYLSTKCY